MEREKIKNIAVRAVSGIMLAAVVIGGFLYSPYSYGAVLVAILVGGMCEFYRMARYSGVATQNIIGIATGLTLWGINFANCFAAEQSSLISKYGMATLIILVCATFILEMYRKSKTPIQNIGLTFMGVVYVALPLALFCYLPTNHGDWNPLIALGCVFIIWANDVFAFCFGITLGKHKLFERLSPKKSWEGFFGGFVCAIAMGGAIGHFLGGDIAKWCGLAAVAAIGSVLGDLIESMFKRSTNIKDSGNAIPGHGGVLDRFDALLIATPLIYVYMVLTEMI